MRTNTFKHFYHYIFFITYSCLSFFILPGQVHGLTTDDFNQPNLNTNLWTLIDPLGDAIISLTGSGTGDAKLLLSVPAGPSHDPWATDTASMGRTSG